jgi:hypothetical protein
MLRTAQSLPPTGALDTGLRPGPFPGRAAGLPPGLLAATRTGLTPAGDDELVLDQVNPSTTPNTGRTLRRVYTRAHDFGSDGEWVRQLGPAKEQIDLMGYTLRSWWFAGDVFQQVLLEKIRNGVRVRILVMDKLTPFFWLA